MNVTTQTDWMSITFPSDGNIASLLPYNFSMIPCKSPIPVYPIAYETFPHRAKILISTEDRLGQHVILSGKTLQSIYEENISAKTIFEHITANKGKLSRIDIALDICDVADFTVAKFKAMLEQADTKFTRHIYIGSEKGIETVYLGSMVSRSRRFRCYDKAVEQEIEDYPWVRLEYEKRRGANELAKRIFVEDVSIAAIIKGVIDFPKWELYQNLLNCAKADQTRGDGKTKNDDWIKTLEWLCGSAATSLANCTYEEYLSQISAKDNEWSINDSVVLNRFSKALAGRLRFKFDR